MSAKHTIFQRVLGAWRGRQWRNANPEELKTLMIARRQRVLVRFVNQCKGSLVGRKVRQDYLMTRSAAVKIQEWWLTISLYEAFWHKKNLVLYLQALSRGHLLRKRIRNLPKRVLCFQALWKGYLIRQRFLLLKHSATLIQRFTRSKQLRVRFLAFRKHVPKIQACIRGYVARAKVQGLMTSQQLEVEKEVVSKAQKVSALGCCLETIKGKFLVMSHDSDSLLMLYYQSNPNVTA